MAKKAFTVSGTTMAILAIVAGILILIWPTFVQWILGIFLIVWGVLAVTFAIVIAALLFGEMSFLRAFLPVQWVADAMGAAREGNPQPSVRALAMLLGIGGGGLLLARRVC